MSDLTLHELEALTIDWAIEKGITKPENKVKQALKMCEEAGEVAGAILKGRKNEIQAEIGDVLVTLCVLAHQHDLTLSECLKMAYLKIKDRTGKTENGVFIKNSDI